LIFTGRRADFSVATSEHRPTQRPGTQLAMASWDRGYITEAR
jgi:hypothetical protein